MASGGAAAQMDPEAAAELVRKGSMLLLLDVPQRTLFGIDT
jgi:A1 cistron-splicing factor AAR2